MNVSEIPPPRIFFATRPDFDPPSNHMGQKEEKAISEEEEEKRKEKTKKKEK